MPLPVGPAGGGVAERVPGVAEPAEGVRLTPAVAEIAGQLKRALVALHGPAVLAEVVVREAETVPGGGLAGAVVELLEEGESPLAVRQRREVLAELGMAPADRVERVGLGPAVAGGPGQDEGPLRVLKGLPRLTLPVPQRGEVLVRTRLALGVPSADVQVEGPLGVAQRVGVLVDHGVGAGEEAVRDCPRDRVAETLGGAQGRAAGLDPALPVPLAVQERVEGPPQPPGVRVESGTGGLAECGDGQRAASAR